LGDEKTKNGGEKLNLKAALLLIMVFFASTITTVTMAISTTTPDSFSTAKTTFATHDIEPGKVELRGDPIDNPVTGS